MCVYDERMRMAAVGSPETWLQKGHPTLLPSSVEESWTENGTTHYYRATPILIMANYDICIVCVESYTR